MARRVPPTVAGGRVRTSTVVLAVLFVVLFVLYLLIRPTPLQATSSIPSPAVVPVQPVQPAPAPAPLSPGPPG